MRRVLEISHLFLVVLNRLVERCMMMTVLCVVSLDHHSPDVLSDLDILSYREARNHRQEELKLTQQKNNAPLSPSSSGMRAAT